MSRRISHCLRGIVSLVLLGTPVLAVEPAADQVLARCAEALGGEANWRAIRSLEISGEFSSFVQVRPFLLRRQRPDLYRFDHAEGIRNLTVAYDGQTAWWHPVNSLASQANWPLIAREPHARMIRSDAELTMPCLEFRQRGHRIELLGEKEIDLERFHELKVTLASGSVEHWLLDRESFLPAARLSIGAQFGSETPRKMVFLDYREVSGVRIPHRVEIEWPAFTESLDVRQVRVNVDFDPTVFSLPVPSGLQPLQSLIGDWSVEVESLDPLTGKTGKQTVSSVIRSLSKGSFLEEEIAFQTAGFPRDVKRLFSYDGFRGTLRIAHLDNFTSHLNLLEGGMDGGRLVLSNLSSGTSWTVHNRTFHSRETISRISRDGFELEREISTDGGATWSPEYRLTYRRTLAATAAPSR